MPTLESQTVQLTSFLLPWIGILISAIIAIMFKDWATSLAKGLQFKWNPAFNEGDTIILDGQEGMIVKIGARARGRAASLMVIMYGDMFLMKELYF